MREPVNPRQSSPSARAATSARSTLGDVPDVLIAISTSGTSPNVLRALVAARALGLDCLGFTGSRTASPASMHATCDAVLAVPSTVTPIIQQLHISAAHVICALVERAMFPQAA